MAAFTPSVHKVPACVNDCMTFGENIQPSNEVHCLMCPEEEPAFSEDKPRKLYYEVTLESIVQRWFACKPIAELLNEQWRQSDNPCYMYGFEGEHRISHQGGIAFLLQTA